ncbi:MAG: hypothetical protein KJ060_10185 [Candidatus Hydrogenedentes bacterium]|nr:hypothetical protein [Candidatus Hydrogenedentota bacterium]
MTLRTRLTLIVLTAFSVMVTEAAPIDELIARAGNAATDDERLAILQELRERADLEPDMAQDVDRLTVEVDRWMNDPRLEYFGSSILKTDQYDFGIAEDSPLFPITELYRARMMTWVTLEFGGLWSNAESKRKQFDKIRPLFESLSQQFPDNPLIKMYLGTPIPAEPVYEPDPDAPAWANAQRESLERMTDILHWWVDHRLRPDGQYGGGWGDDCEMWRIWIPVLIGFDDPKIGDAQERFSSALMAQSHMSEGYTSHVYDVEHTAEDSADALTPMMLLQPENPLWRDKAMRLAELMRDLWSGVNERGQLQFKSIYFSSKEVDLTPKRACDTVYHPRAVQPALLLWQRTGDEQLGSLFSSWMDTWVEATARAERGKPAGIIPSAIHWPDGSIGGVGENWWDPEGHSSDPLYVWPSAMSLMTQSLLLAHHMTGDPKYLEPLRSMADARLRFLKDRPAEISTGSEAWCAERLGSLTGVLAKYRFLTGNGDFDELLRRDSSAYVKNRLNGDLETLAKALEQTAAGLRINFPGFTSEVRYTDRVMRFPSIFGVNGMFPDGKPGINTPDILLLYATVSGDPDHPQVFPFNAVRWLTPAREIAALVADAKPDRFEAMLYHFGDEPRGMAAQFYLLKPGAYSLRITSGDERIEFESRFNVTGSGSTASFTLPAGTTCTMVIEPEK